MLKLLMLFVAVTAILASIVFGLGEAANSLTEKYRSRVESVAKATDTPSDINGEWSDSIWQ